MRSIKSILNTTMTVGNLTPFAMSIHGNHGRVKQKVLKFIDLKRDGFKVGDFVEMKISIEIKQLKPKKARAFKQ